MFSPPHSEARASPSLGRWGKARLREVGKLAKDTQLPGGRIPLRRHLCLTSEPSSLRCHLYCLPLEMAQGLMA